jgi:DNA-directed RNA polymerase specialized sigma24 family protein
MSGGVWTQGFDEIVEKFDSYRSGDKRLDRLADELASICYKQVAGFSDMPKTDGGTPELVRYVEHRESVRERLIQQLERLSTQFDEVIAMTKHLNGIEYQVVTLYYIRGWPMHRVSQEINYSVRQCWNIRDRAFYEIAQTLHTIAQ